MEALKLDRREQGVVLLLGRRAALPASDAWLAPGEARKLHGMRFEKRRSDFRLGRFTAKRLIAAMIAPGADLARIDVENDREGAPHVGMDGGPAPCSLSISHRGGVALAAVGPSGMRLGCDVEQIEPRSEAFVADDLDAAERARLREAPAAERNALANLYWSAKESALKAWGVGLRIDTRDVAVEAPAQLESRVWAPLRIEIEGEPLRGWATRLDRWVITVASDPDPGPPTWMGAA